MQTASPQLATTLRLLHCEIGSVRVRKQIGLAVVRRASGNGRGTQQSHIFPVMSEKGAGLAAVDRRRRCFGNEDRGVGEGPREPVTP